MKQPHLFLVVVPVTFVGTDHTEAEAELRAALGDQAVSITRWGSGRVLADACALPMVMTSEGLVDAIAEYIVSPKGGETKT